MPQITDYNSLSQAIQNFSHRPTIGTYVDYFIQGAQEQITTDILAQNFGKGIRLMEAPYGPTAILSDGTAPVPSDWIAPKLFTLSADDNQFDIEFKDPQWIYSRYPLREPDGIPAYIGRDVYAPSGAPSGLAPSASFTATAGQTAFSLAALNGASVILVSVNGVTLTPSTDYGISGTTLTLTTGATVGEIVVAQAIPASASLTDSGDQVLTATAGQTAFALSAPAGSLLLFAALNGAVLNPAGDYSVSGATLTLAQGAVAGQTLLVRYISTGSVSGSSVFIFGPFPDQSYTIQGTYYQKPAALSASQTTNWLVLNAPSMLHAACMVEAGKFLKDVQMVQGWTQIYESKLQSFLGFDLAERYGAGPLVINAA